MSTFDTVIAGGRVIDPETGLDAVRNVGVSDGRVTAVSETVLDGDTVLDATGLVVAPGFIDLHSHTQSIPGDRIQAFDGVTTALELESGILPIGRWYDAQVAAGRAINYGASAAWSFARVAVMNPEHGAPDGTLEWFQKAFGLWQWSTQTATGDQVDRILQMVEEGLNEGGIGIGINNGYAPGAGTQELGQVAALAAKHQVPTYTHISFMSNIDPASSYEAYLHLIAYAATTGAHMHICHLNSTSVRDIVRCAEAIQTAQKAGLKITTEAYPYGAASTAIGAAFFLDPHFRERTGSDWSDIVVNATGERVATEARLRELQAANPGEPIVWHFLHEDDDHDQGTMLDLSNLMPGAAVASDAMPWAMPDGSFLYDDVWPIPADAVAHPRSAACFGRYFARYYKTGKLPLPDAIARCSLRPAQILEESTPSMKRKGRLQLGTDADIIVFDPDEFEDRATYGTPGVPSVGMRHVLVNGTSLIRDAQIDTTALPGRPVRRRKRFSSPAASCPTS